VFATEKTLDRMKSERTIDLELLLGKKLVCGLHPVPKTPS
jgi:hypothetical protein